jgi:predicted TIM-barrel fold metal-dependent hydrolase
MPHRRRRYGAHRARLIPLEVKLIDLENIIAIDVHTHAEISCRQPLDPIQAEFIDAASSYFKTEPKRPTIQETIDYYRARKIAFVMFTVDMEAGTGIKRIANEEIAEAAAANSDIMIPFASIDPHKGKLGALEARRMVEQYGVKGFKCHPPMQNFDPGDRMAWPIYDVIAEYGLPAIFHTGHSGMGTGMPGGGGIRLKFGQPMLVDDVAADFPDMKIILAHPSWPWTDEALSMALHKNNVFIDLSGWLPKYFPKQVIQYANTQLKHKMLFGSDFPLISPDKWIESFKEVGFRENTWEPILKGNAQKLLFKS